MQLYWETLQIFLALFGLEFMFVASFDRQLLLVPLVKPNPKRKGHNDLVRRGGHASRIFQLALANP